jgi:hypothetical protein
VERSLRIVGIDPEKAYTPKEIKELKNSGTIDENAPPVIKKIHKAGKVEADPLHGLFETTIAGKTCIVEYEPDTELRDTEQIPLLEDGGIEAFICREVLPYAPDAWIDDSKTQVGYESASIVTSTSRSPCAHWKKSGPIFWRWNWKPRYCSTRLLVKESVMKITTILDHIDSGHMALPDSSGATSGTATKLRACLIRFTDAIPSGAYWYG